jgi:lysozyme
MIPEVRGLIFVALAACASEQVGEREQAIGTPQCPMMVVEGLDVYQGTGTIDWTKVHDSGRAFAFIKATQGDYNTQSTFPTNWTNAAAAGLLRSAYHFFDPTIDGALQATHFLATLDAAGGMTSTDLPPMLDIECPVSSSQSTSTSQGPNCEYAGNSGWVATATMQQRIFDWLAAVEAATGRKPLIYSYPSWFGDLQFTDPRLAGYPLFIATYASCASVPAPWTTSVFWQYSASATVPGITGSVDVDRFFGSAGDLQTWNTVPVDAGVGDAGDAKPSGGGCCRTDAGGTSWWLAFVVALRILRRRDAIPRTEPCTTAGSPLRATAR